LKGTPAIGLVNVQVRGEREARIRLLKEWLNAGLDLGNQTYSHPDPNRIPLNQFTDGILQGEVVTRRLLEQRGDVSGVSQL